MDAKHTLRYMPEVLGVPVVVINWPGYGGTPTLPDLPETEQSAETTFIQRHGRWLNEPAVPVVFKEFSSALSVSSVLSDGESVGGIMAIVVAALHARADTPQYTLAALLISAVGCRPNTEPLRGFFEN